MCGIAGKVDFNGAVVDRAIVSRMCDTIVHRGPDAKGIYTAPYVGLGSCRLAIIDLDPSANPPVANEDETVWVVFNGEIYNFRELRTLLIRRGHTLKTAGDTEVLVHLYEEYGTDLVQHLNGMFAFAIWDANKKILFAVRDRLGKKPFYYTNTGRSFIFGSAIKAITADPSVSISPNYAAIDSYLSYQYVPSPVTAFANIFKLRPGHYLLCHVNGNVEITRYWTPPLSEKPVRSEEETIGGILDLLSDAVRLRLYSDVPLGAFLSGGIDSGAVVAMMARHSSKPVKTFSIGFEEDEFNELPYARLVAERYGTDHHELVLKPSVMDVLPLLVRHYNEPFADSSAVPTYYVSQITAEHVSVALSGDGGDESFAGYERYGEELAWGRVDAIPWVLRHGATLGARRISNGLPYSNFGARVSRGLAMLGGRLPDRYYLQMTIVKEQEKKAWYTDKFKNLIHGHDVRSELEIAWNSRMDSLDWMMRHDQNYYLPDCLMVKTDVASMANSLELRCPFLDYRLVEYAATIPSDLKRDRAGGKRILRKAFKDLLPNEVLTKRKSGFGVPIARWFREDLRDLLHQAFFDEVAIKRGLFNTTALRRVVDEHVAGRRDWSNRLWALLFLELWFREFID